MSSVTKSHLSVDTTFSLFSFLSDRCAFLPCDSDKSDKRSCGLEPQCFQSSDKGKYAVTKECWPVSKKLLSLGLLSCYRLETRMNKGSQAFVTSVTVTGWARRGRVKSQSDRSASTGRIDRFFHAQVL